MAKKLPEYQEEPEQQSTTRPGADEAEFLRSLQTRENSKLILSGPLDAWFCREIHRILAPG
jgi:hypothetical protein